MIVAICNPTAGSGRAKRIGAQIEEKLKEAGCACRLVYSERPGHATELARAARADGAELVLSVGGDGTALETARGLIGSDCPLGVIPAGTGNDFVKTLGIPQEPLAALSHILAHPARKTDVGEINGRVFLNEIGTGFDVSVLDHAEKAKKYCRGLLPYLYGVVKTLFRFRSVPITFSIEGGEEKTLDAFVIGAANGGMIGGGIPIAPDAKADDGLLDIVIVQKIPRAKLLARLLGLMRKKVLAFPETLYFRASSIIFSMPNMRLNIDGEIVPEEKAEARIIPGALLIRR